MFAFLLFIYSALLTVICSFFRLDWFIFTDYQFILQIALYHHSFFLYFATLFETALFANVLAFSNIASKSKNRSIFNYLSFFLSTHHKLNHHKLDCIKYYLPVMTIYFTFWIEWLLTNYAYICICPLFCSIFQFDAGNIFKIGSWIKKIKCLLGCERGHWQGQTCLKYFSTAGQRWDTTLSRDLLYTVLNYNKN